VLDAFSSCLKEESVFKRSPWYIPAEVGSQFFSINTLSKLSSTGTIRSHYHNSSSPSNAMRIPRRSFSSAGILSRNISSQESHNVCCTNLDFVVHSHVFVLEETTLLRLAPFSVVRANQTRKRCKNVFVSSFSRQPRDTHIVGCDHSDSLHICCPLYDTPPRSWKAHLWRL
jgi:hypothetical protein